MRIVADKKYKQMFWLEWDDKVRSDRFYNKTRAKCHMMVIVNDLPDLPAGEFK